VLESRTKKAKIVFKIKLKELRENAGLSQSGLAKELGIVQGTVGNWESGIREPNFKMVKKIARYFNITVDELIED